MAEALHTLKPPRSRAQAAVWLELWRGDDAPLRWALGMALWAAGAVANMQADHHLLDLRRAAAAAADPADAADPGTDAKAPPAQRVYRIPHAGLFRWVSAANYAGEIGEWTGYALASGHGAAWAFAAFTVRAPPASGTEAPDTPPASEGLARRGVVQQRRVCAAAQVCMLAPRARQHHHDYLSRFGHLYPLSRTALVPFLW